MRYLTIEDILIIAETHVDNHQILHKEQLDYLVEAISAKFGDTELYPTPFQKLRYMPIILLQDTYFSTGTNVSV